MSDWNSEFNGILIKYNKQLVQIKTDENLLDFLEKKGNGSLELAEYILQKYHSIFNCKLDISKESLSVEILVHAYLDVLFKKMEKAGNAISPDVLKSLISFMKKMQGHTDIIDSGERSVDPNRHIFDSLAPFSGAIYFMLGKYA